MENINTMEDDMIFPAIKMQSPNSKHKFRHSRINNSNSISKKLNRLTGPI